eukprot:PITA_07602
MVDEYDSIVRNIVLEVFPRPKNKSVAGFMWIYKVKQVANGSFKKHKAIFLAKGFSHVEGIDYKETFSLVARYSSIKSILALAMQMGWKIHQMDVRTPFLNGLIKEEVYIEQLEGFETFGDEKLVKSCEEDLSIEFKLKVPCLMHYFLDMEVWQGDGELFVSQGKYANEILKKFHMESSKPMETPLAGNWRKEDATSGEVVEATIYEKLVAPLMYLVNTRPDMCYEFNQINQSMVRPTKLYWKETKHVLRYLRCTTQYGLWYKQAKGVKL